MPDRRQIKLEDLVEQVRAGALEVPEGYALDVLIDKGCASFSFHPGWDEDGEERDDDPVYLDVAPRNGPDQIEVLLRLLGIEARHA